MIEVKVDLFQNGKNGYVIVTMKKFCLSYLRFYFARIFSANNQANSKLLI